MRVRKPQTFDPAKEYTPGERLCYRGMVIITKKWGNPQGGSLENGFCRCGCCAIKREDCPAEGLKCHCSCRADKKTIYFKFLYNTKK